VASSTKLGGRIAKGLLLVVPFFLCALSVQGAEWCEWRVDVGSLNPQRPPQLVLTGDGTPVVGFFDADDRILVRPYRREPIAINTNPERGKPSGLALHSSGQHVYAAWRETRRGKSQLLLRVSPDGGVTWPESEVLIDEVTQPLKRVVLAGDQAHLHIAWLGSQAITPSDKNGVSTIVQEPSAPGNSVKRDYHVYARYSADSGESWGQTCRLTEGYRESIWPTLIADGAGAYSFSWSQRDDVKLLLFTRTATGSDWQAPVAIAEVGDVLLLEPRLLDGRLLVVWLTQYREKGYLIEGAVSDNKGRTWNRFTVPDSLGMDVANLDVAGVGDNVYLTFSARRKAPREAGKLDVYFARSADGGLRWSHPISLPRSPFRHTKAVYPRLLAGPPVLVVWNDFRNIRGDLYMNCSRDAGATWQQKDRALGAQGLSNDFLYPFNEALVRSRDTYFLLAGRYSGDLVAGPAELYLHRFSSSSLLEPTESDGSGDATDTRRRLEQRAKRFWQSLTAGDYETTYALFDPFYRANFRKVDYLSSTGRIRFKSFDLKRIIVKGKLGRVVVDYEYEIPPLRTSHGQIARPLTRATQMETWLFLDGDWFKEYRNEAGDFSFARY
jgi:hypothetical protein